MSSMFSGVESVQLNNRAPYITPGLYLLRCKLNKQGTSRKKIPFFVAEFEVLESNNPDHPAGSSVNWMIQFPPLDPDKCRMALGNVKSYASALMDTPTSEVTEEGLEDLTSAANPAEGFKIRAEAFNKPTRNGSPFTHVIWSTVAQ